MASSFSQVLGFQRAPTVDGVEAPTFVGFSRARPQKGPFIDSYSLDACAGEIGVTLARNFEDLSARGRDPQCGLCR